MFPAPVAAALSLLLALPAAAAEIQKQATLNTDAETVWKTVGDFCGIAAWHPGVAHCEKDGPRRILTLREGARLVDRQLERDDAAMRYTYTMEEGALPVSDDFRAVLQVNDLGDRTRVVWRAEFTPAPGQSDAMASAVLGRIFEAGLDGLRRRLRE